MPSTRSSYERRSEAISRAHSDLSGQTKKWRHPHVRSDVSRVRRGVSEYCPVRERPIAARWVDGDA